jgi:hypothetical protein
MIALSFERDWAGRPVIDLVATPSAPQIEAMGMAGEPSADSIPISALVDTGAGRSIMQRADLAKFDLIQLGTEWLNTASSGETPLEVRVFAVQLLLTGVAGVTLAADLPVLEVEDLSGLGVDMLLGRDVLDRCLLFYSGQERRFTLAF